MQSPRALSFGRAPATLQAGKGLAVPRSGKGSRLFSASHGKAFEPTPRPMTPRKVHKREKYTNRNSSFLFFLETWVLFHQPWEASDIDSSVPGASAWRFRNCLQVTWTCTCRILRGYRGRMDWNVMNVLVFQKIADVNDVNSSCSQGRWLHTSQSRLPHQSVSQHWTWIFELKISVEQKVWKKHAGHIDHMELNGSWFKSCKQFLHALISGPSTELFFAE